ncbi:acetyl-CoA hydrolase/transferase family protein [Aeromicrobium duanguangcaii]|uniref:Acetyl-CoA hydrolase/transferase family protein n=1 Tax=Aeromicrobium duanguangcaii TaxID=2968086 RepID=A0ABY5KGX4_9ACTN|nr:acetyl-CoA hydrolase/transferase family protein [Aeromicrobium duanguangcaii]MCD9153182.1 acetyl-CoA hydrolase/transferase family protein [Aeromicrobium duanguangcaii]UUI69717.1 acetyl-CoA hydrolase/transferase family protein [Aeromicrobium duanguangcaii]
MSRVSCPVASSRIMSAEEAVQFIRPGDNVGMSGFTGAGYPKAVPSALAARARAAHQAGEDFRIGLWTGASTAPQADGVLADAHAISTRLPYNSDPILRRQINAGEVDYVDAHLSHSAQQMWFGFYGPLDVAVIEVTAILPDGLLVPSSSVGNNKTWLDQADKVILEVNHWQPREFEGFHDIYGGTALPPYRRPLELTEPMQRIGEPYLKVDPAKIVAVVETDAPDEGAAFSAPDHVSRAIAGHALDFLRGEVGAGRMPPELLPLQSGVGNVANAVLQGLDGSEFTSLVAYTEVLQDSMLTLLDSGTLRAASTASFGLSREGMQRFRSGIDGYKGRILMRSEEISNHPEIIRRLGIIAMNGLIEADIYGNVNSTHIMGSSVMNGIGGSGDFARNAYLNFFLTPSTAKNGAISTIVPMVSHVDHTEHDVHVIVTEFGLADLRGLSPRERAEQVIANCAHPDFRPRLRDYFERAYAARPDARHTPHLLDEALSWHQRYLDTGSM